MKKKGFTLIELLVVIAIIGLLSTLAVVSLNSARGKARDAKKISDVKAIQTAMEMYKSDSSNNVATTATTSLAAYIQGGFPTGNSYYMCASTSFYVIGVQLEQATTASGTYTGAFPPTNWTTCAPSVPASTNCGSNGWYCVGSSS